MLNQLKESIENVRSDQHSQSRDGERISELREANATAVEKARSQQATVNTMACEIAGLEKEILDLRSQLALKTTEMEELHRKPFGDSELRKKHQDLTAHATELLIRAAASKKLETDADAACRSKQMELDEAKEKLTQALSHVQALESQAAEYGPAEKKAVKNAEKKLQSLWEKKYSKMEKQLGGSVKTAEACKFSAEQAMEKCQEDLKAARAIISSYQNKENSELKRYKADWDAAQDTIARLCGQLRSARDDISMPPPNQGVSPPQASSISGEHGNIIHPSPYQFSNSLREVGENRQEVVPEPQSPSLLKSSSRGRVAQRRSSSRPLEVSRDSSGPSIANERSVGGVQFYDPKYSTVTTVDSYSSTMELSQDPEQDISRIKKRVRIGGQTSKSPVQHNDVDYEPARKENRKLQSKDANKAMPVKSAMKASPSTGQTSTEPSNLGYQDEMRATQKAKEDFENAAPNLIAPMSQSRASRSRSISLHISGFGQAPYNRIKSGIPHAQVASQPSSQASYVPPSSAEDHTVDVVQQKTLSKRKRSISAVPTRKMGQHWREPSPEPGRTARQ